MHEKEDFLIPKALTIAGNDTIGGAGIAADLKTMLACGVYGMPVITALTAQNTMGVSAIEDVSESFIKEQINAVYRDVIPDAVKVGMLGRPSVVRAVTERLVFYKVRRLVVDPVMVATSGAKLLTEDAERELVHLFALATVITPNLTEAEALLGRAISSEEEMERAATELRDWYGTAVLVKGGHAPDGANDVLASDEGVRWYRVRRIPEKSENGTHGTGCTLSSAIASYLARGLSLEEAVGRAKDYTYGAIEHAFTFAEASNLLDHGWVINREK